MSGFDRRQEAMRSLPPALRQMLERGEVLRAAGSSRAFKLVDVLDGGGFATLFRCVEQGSSHEVAAKIAVDMVSDDEGRLTAEQLAGYVASMRREHKVYEQLLKAGGGPKGVPAVHFAGGTKRAGDAQHPKKLHFLSFLVMDLLGPSCGQLSLDLQAYRRDTKLLVNHGLGMLQALRCMHDAGLVHRDVKPDNFCLPRGYDATGAAHVDAVFVVDMGFAQPWQHAGFDWWAEDSLFVGTPDYASVRALRGCHQTPRDDLESLGCTLLEMAMGDVPFDLNPGDGELVPERLQQMAVQKEQRWQQLLAKASTPAFVKQWLRHVRSVPPLQPPRAADYEALAGILRAALAPRADPPATSAWSSAAPLLQATRSGAEGGRKRAAPASGASTLASCVSEAATVLQPKRLRGCGPPGALCCEAEEDDEASMACGGLLAVSQGREE